jgi:predicted nucleic acid-binding protein
MVFDATNMIVVHITYTNHTVRIYRMFPLLALQQRTDLLISDTLLTSRLKLLTRNKHDIQFTVNC